MKKGLFAVMAVLAIVGLTVACAPTAAPVATAAPAEKNKFTFEMPNYPESAVGTEMVDTTKYKKDPPWTIAYANASTSNPWRSFTVAALYYEASKYPELFEKIIHTNANDSIPKQISDMEDLIVQGVDAIILPSTSAEALNPVIDKAMAAGIPVIILERGVATTNYVTFIDVDPPSIATKTAEYFVNGLKGQGDVVWFGITPGLTISNQQETAVKAVFAKNPGIKPVAFDYGLSSLAKHKSIMEAWLQTYPKIDGVLSWSGAGLLGAVEAAKEAGRLDEIKFWAGAEGMGFLKLMKEGLPSVGYASYADCTIDALHASMRILSGQPVPKSWHLPVVLITPENVDKYYVAGAPANWYASRIPLTEVQKWLDFAAKK